MAVHTRVNERRTNAVGWRQRKRNVARSPVSARTGSRARSARSTFARDSGDRQSVCLPRTNPPPRSLEGRPLVLGMGRPTGANRQRRFVEASRQSTLLPQGRMSPLAVRSISRRRPRAATKTTSATPGIEATSRRVSLASARRCDVRHVAVVVKVKFDSLVIWVGRNHYEEGSAFRLNHPRPPSQ